MDAHEKYYIYYNMKFFVILELKNVISSTINFFLFYLVLSVWIWTLC